MSTINMSSGPLPGTKDNRGEDEHRWTKPELKAKPLEKGIWQYSPKETFGIPVPHGATG
jgi:hypothetical protein